MIWYRYVHFLVWRRIIVVSYRDSQLFAGPLFVLTQKNADFVWGQAQEASFCQLKLLVHAPVLAFPDFGQQFILKTDASGCNFSSEAVR